MELSSQFGQQPSQSANRSARNARPACTLRVQAYLARTPCFKHNAERATRTSRSARNARPVCDALASQTCFARCVALQARRRCNITGAREARPACVALVTQACSTHARFRRARRARKTTHWARTRSVRAKSITEKIIQLPILWIARSARSARAAQRGSPAIAGDRSLNEQLGPNCYDPTNLPNWSDLIALTKFDQGLTKPSSQSPE